MIKVIVADKAHSNGKFEYIVPGYPVQGLSRQPLLDACRELKRLKADAAEEAGLFRAGREEWDLKTTVGFGATQTVDEFHNCFAPWKAFRP